MTKEQKLTAINSLIAQIAYTREEVYDLEADIIGWEADIEELELELEED
jgi:hypothetical protein